MHKYIFYFFKGIYNYPADIWTIKKYISGITKHFLNISPLKAEENLKHTQFFYPVFISRDFWYIFFSYIGQKYNLMHRDFQRNILILISRRGTVARLWNVRHWPSFSTLLECQNTLSSEDLFSSGRVMVSNSLQIIYSCWGTEYETFVSQYISLPYQKLSNNSTLEVVHLPLCIIS